MLLNKDTSTLEVMCPPVLISSEIIPSTLGDFLFFKLLYSVVYFMISYRWNFAFICS